MSSDDSNNKDKDTKKKDDATPSMPDLSIPEFPTMTDLRATLQSGLHQGVQVSVHGINAALGQLQHTSDAIRKPAVSGMEHLQEAGVAVATETRIAYERRHEFGPYYVVGATLGIGGMTALRRGKGPGIVLGGLAGAVTYAALYEPLMDAPTFSVPNLPNFDSFEWPFKNLTDNLPGRKKD